LILLPISKNSPKVTGGLLGLSPNCLKRSLL